MSNVIKIKEDSSGRIGGLSERSERTYKRVFTVETEDHTHGPEIVLNADDGNITIPERFDAYTPASGELDLTAFMVAKDCELIGTSRLIWKVTCYYTNRFDPTMIEDPLERPAKISIDTNNVSVPIIQNIFGKPLLNSAEDPFDPNPEDEDCRTIVRVTVNRADFDQSLYEQRNNTVNNQEYVLNHVIYKPRHVKFRKARADQINENNLWFWSVTYEFELRKERIPNNAWMQDEFDNWFSLNDDPSQDDPRGDVSYAWTRFLQDRGFRVIDRTFGPVLNRLTTARDPRFFQAFTTAPLLDGSGNLLPFGDEAFYIAHDTLFGSDFNDLFLFESVG